VAVGRSTNVTSTGMGTTVIVILMNIIITPGMFIGARVQAKLKRRAKATGAVLTTAATA